MSCNSFDGLSAIDENEVTLQQCSRIRDVVSHRIHAHEAELAILYGADGR
jgi:hypothetical protein